MSRRPAVIGLALAAGAVAVAAATRDWSVRSIPGLPAAASTPVTGRDLVPQVAALGLVVAAAAVVLGTAGRAVRMIAAVATLLAGAGIVAGVVPVLGGDGAIGRPNGWAWVALVAGVVATGAGLAAIVLSRGWPAPASRYERRVGTPSGPRDAEATADARSPVGDADADGEADVWARLSRGDDPT